MQSKITATGGIGSSLSDSLAWVRLVCTVNIVFTEILDHHLDLIDDLLVLSVQHSKEDCDLLLAKLIVLPEHRLPHISDEMNYAFINIVQFDQVFLRKLTAHAILKFVLELFKLHSGFTIGP